MDLSAPFSVHGSETSELAFAGGFPRRRFDDRGTPGRAGAGPLRAREERPDGGEGLPALPRKARCEAEDPNRILVCLDLR
jgi:hypothetical protein